MLKYIGTSVLRTKSYGDIKPGDLITDDFLCEKLAGRADFITFEEDEEKPKIIKKRR